MTPAPHALYDLRSSGLLWLINRVVFHPRGLALGLYVGDDGTVTGWSLVRSAGDEPFWFDPADDIESFRAAQATLSAAARLDHPTAARGEGDRPAAIGAERDRWVDPWCNSHSRVDD